jgi:dTDP-4-dehydrorhamnose reductase
LGDSKLQAEREIAALGGRALMIRTAALFSPYDPHNFAAQLVRALANDLDVPAAADLVVSPTYVPDLVEAVLDLMIDGETGIRHLANDGAVSWAEFARRIAEAAGYDPELVRPVPAAVFGWPAARPIRAPLATERGWMMPGLDHAIAKFAAMNSELEFTAEVEALAEGAPETRAVRRSAAVS